jgi:hypothetical protein
MNLISGNYYDITFYKINKIVKLMFIEKYNTTLDHEIAYKFIDLNGYVVKYTNSIVANSIFINESSNDTITIEIEDDLYS